MTELIKFSWYKKASEILDCGQSKKNWESTLRRNSSAVDIKE